METQSREMKGTEVALKEHDQTFLDLKEQFKRLEERVNQKHDHLCEILSGLSCHVQNLCATIHPNGQLGENSAAQEQTYGGADGGVGALKRIGTIKFPKFAGVDFDGWLYKVNQFFELDSTPDELKIKLVSIHLDDDTLQWHQSYMKSYRAASGQITWHVYIEAMAARFSQKGYEDRIGELTALFQEGTLKDYLKQFDKLLYRVEIPEEHAVSFFIAGLDPDIGNHIRMFNPHTMQECYALAKQQETIITTRKKGEIKDQIPNQLKPPPQTYKPLTVQPTKSEKKTQDGLLPLPSDIKPLHPTKRPYPNCNTRTLTEKEIEDLSPFFEWQQEREIQAEVEAMVIAVYFKGVLEELEGILWDEGSQVGVNGSINFPKKRMEVFSSLRHELDGLNKQLSVPVAGHTASIGPMEYGEECGNSGSSKVTSHLHKLSSSHVFSSSPPWETNGKHEELTITMPENIDPAKLVHLTKENLGGHFDTEMIKMKRNHDSKVQEITEECFRLKREYFREHSSSLPLKKDKDLDELRRKTPEVILKLDEILVQNEAFPSLNIDVERLGKMEDKLDGLLSENSHLRDMLVDKKGEIKRPSAEVYDVGKKISSYYLAETNLLEVIENLKCEQEEERIKFTIYEEVYQCILRRLPIDICYINDNLCTESNPRKGICEVSSQEAISDGRNIRKSEIENPYMETLISQELSELVFVQVLKEAMEKFDCLNNECLYEMFLQVSLEQEVLAKTELAKFELARAKELFDHETRRQGLLFAEISKELEEIKSDLHQALEKNEMYKEEYRKLNQKLGFVMEELNQKERERKLLLHAAQEREDKLLLAEENERLYKRQMESITEFAHGVMKSLADVENRATEDIKWNLSRVGMLTYELNSLTQAAKLMKRWGLTFKQRLERKCLDLDKAENEVDLLGDKVDNLSGLLEKIYIALDHYSPILKHYPGVMEILKLVKGELSGDSVKSD